MTTQSEALCLLDVGLSDFDATYEMQRSLLLQRKSGKGFDSLILVEHPEIYTFGRGSKESLGIPNARRIERGGEVTLHNPGQLVAYPILCLREGERDLHLYLRRLEETLIGVLSDFGLQGESRAGATGVWLVGKDRKIASLGVAVSGWVSYHGCALNVRNDLSGFSRIRPCGFSPEVMTSMKKELGQRLPGMEEVKESFVRHFCKVFGRYLVV